MSTSEIKNFTDLIAWKEAHQLALVVYKTTKKFPPSEKFGLTSQIRRAAISIVSNIAEGFGRNTAKDKAQFYAIAKGSVLELQSQLLIAKDLEYIDAGEFERLNTHIFKCIKLISGLVKSAMDR